MEDHIQVADYHNHFNDHHFSNVFVTMERPEPAGAHIHVCRAHMSPLLPARFCSTPTVIYCLLNLPILICLCRLFDVTTHTSSDLEHIRQA